MTEALTGRSPVTGPLRHVLGGPLWLLASLGLHVLTLPIIAGWSGGLNFQPDRTVGLVELSPEEQARLPVLESPAPLDSAAIAQADPRLGKLPTTPGDLVLPDRGSLPSSFRNGRPDALDRDWERFRRQTDDLADSRESTGRSRPAKRSRRDQSDAATGEDSNDAATSTQGGKGGRSSGRRRVDIPGDAPTPRPSATPTPTPRPSASPTPTPRPSGQLNYNRRAVGNDFAANNSLLLSNKQHPWGQLIASDPMPATEGDPRFKASFYFYNRDKPLPVQPPQLFCSLRRDFVPGQVQIAALVGPAGQLTVGQKAQLLNSSGYTLPHSSGEALPLDNYVLDEFERQFPASLKLIPKTGYRIFIFSFEFAPCPQASPSPSPRPPAG